MKKNGKLLLSIFWLLLGVTLYALGVAEVLSEFWSGMGAAMVAVAVLQLIRNYRLRKDPEYRENWETQQTDERNHFLRGKAWQWAGTLFVITAGICVIVFQVLGQRELSLAASYSVCYLLIIYWGSWLVLQKKY